MLRLKIVCCWVLLLAACGSAAPAAPPTTVAVATVSSTVAPAPPVAPTATIAPLPTVVPSPTPMPPPRVGIQVGHWQLDDLPAELANLARNTGTYYRGVEELDINRDLAERLRIYLEAAGVVVDVLPTTLPPGYRADAFVALHVDGAPSSLMYRRGWKVAAPWRASQASEHLRDAVAATYGPATGLPQDTRGNQQLMRGYYAFNFHAFEHAIAPTTPAIIVEVGFLTNADDRLVLLDQPDLMARGIGDGVLRYLAQRDPADGAALQPVFLPDLRPRRSGVEMYAEAYSDAAVIITLDGSEELLALKLIDGWYLCTIRGNWTIDGWVRQADVLLMSPQDHPLGDGVDASK